MNVSHLRVLTDDVGLFEHCEGSEPRYEHGYCVDDVARAVVVLQRAHSQDSGIQDLLRKYLAFLEQAQDSSGRMWNRRSVGGAWHEGPSTHDHWGRAMWAWGVTVRTSSNPEYVARAYERFALSGRRRSAYLRSMAFAALGASEVLHVLPGNSVAVELLRDAVAAIPTSAHNGWIWPERRLTYANAVIPDVLMRAGVQLQQPHLARTGITMLEWLIEVQSTGDRLSVIPHNGWSSGDLLPAFDQQPIEVAALVDACATAYDITSDPIWSRRVHLGYQWFEGNNDKGIAMFDPATGAGFDGLTEQGRNENQGAESTIAFLSVAHTAEVFAGAPT
jgi:hypothetical protein